MAQQEDNKFSNTVVLIFGISSSNISTQTVQLAHLKNILVNYFLPFRDENIKAFSWIFQHSDSTGSWNPSSISYTPIVADVLATQGARSVQSW